MLIKLAAAGAVLIGGVLVAVAPAAAATACDVTYAANQWSTGFTADVRVTNNGAPVTGWAVTWAFPGNQQVTSGWNAQLTQSGSAVTAAAPPYNMTLATGGSASFGFQATYSGTNTAPTAFALNGVACNGDAPPTPPPSTPPPSTPPPSTPPPSTPPPAGCGSGARCDGFEGTQADWAVTYPDCSGAGKTAYDTTVAHGGSTSLRVDGAAGYCNHVFMRNTSLLPAAATALFVRYWVRHTTALPAAHTTAVALRDANDGNRDLRLGGQNGALQWNRASDDATLPEQSPAGVALSAPLPTGTWNCVEFKVDQGDGTMQTWLNGTSVPGLLQDGVPTHDIDGQWLNRTWRPALTDLRLGWESYGEGADTLWYDDVAVGTTRVGC
ncbi:cellulose-binding protein [Actinoplanes sp. ATCC 53533]|uniref:cellulose-binding domain-containing protein n=1 Tax=Actinoplanes sp. ATCC 53533 TaxID=1288362 RepID=UPI000F7705A3|nr:cellulose-binding domain-containing protein [Actinoplanes sp. ATCC 53533]RSM55662.1 cellulose-binding protein [Actinoplanes sp. ATCC 53533]